MDDSLIRRSDAIKALYKYNFVSKDVIEQEINAIPSADRPTGKWIAQGDCGVTKCNRCGWSIEECIDYNYCPSCGAKMGGESSG